MVDKRVCALEVTQIKISKSWLVGLPDNENPARFHFSGNGVNQDLEEKED
jgi:hypothetical protein